MDAIGAGERMMYVDGECSPAAGEAADVDIAVATARRTFDSGVWRNMGGPERERILWRASELIEAQADSDIVRREVFGPVVSVNVFDEEEEVLAAANDPSYGLASAVWTRDIGRAHRAGLAWINCPFVLDPSMPGGGFKQSGWGREFGQEGLESHLQSKSVFAAL